VARIQIAVSLAGRCPLTTRPRLIDKARLNWTLADEGARAG
jgi:hypothetical protein